MWTALRSFSSQKAKTSTRYNKLLSRITGPFTVAHVKSHVIKNDRTGTPDTISIDRAKPVPTLAYVLTSTTLNLDPTASTTVLHSKDTEYKEPPEYIVDKVGDHHQTSET